MPASHKSDGSTKHSTKVIATLKQKVVNALLLKRRGKDQLSDTSSTKSNEPSIIEESTTDVEEGADAELGMSPLHSYNKEELITMFRAIEKGLECTKLLLFPPSTNC